MTSVPAGPAMAGSPAAAFLVGAPGSVRLRQIELLQLPAEFIVPGDDIEILLQTEYMQSAHISPKRDSSVALFQAIQSVPGDIHPLCKKYRRYASTQSSGTQSLAKGSHLPLDRRKWPSKGPSHCVRYYRQSPNSVNSIGQIDPRLLPVYGRWSRGLWLCAESLRFCSAFHRQLKRCLNGGTGSTECATNCASGRGAVSAKTSHGVPAGANRRRAAF